MYDFINFLKTGKTSKQKSYFTDFVTLFFILYFIELLLLSGKGLILGENWIDPEDFDLLNWSKFFSYVIMIPIVEELMFRSPLLFHKNKWIGYVMFPIIIAGCYIFVKIEWLKHGLAILFLLLGISFFTSKKAKKSIVIFITNNYLTMVYVTSILFGLMHMQNYENIDLKAFLSVLNRIVGGFYFAFLVTKYQNLGASILMHAINNSTVFIFLLIAQYFFHSAL